MKILKNILKVLFVLIFLIIVALFILIKTVDINKYKPQITSLISKSLQRDVAVEKVSLNLSLEGMKLLIKGIEVADYSEFSKKNIISVDRASLDVDILAFLIQRKILSSSIELHAPVVNIIKNEQGKVNVATLASQANKPTSHLDDENQDKVLDSTQLKARPKDSLPEIFIKSIRIVDGTVHYDDQANDALGKLSIEKLNLSVFNFSMQETFRYQLTASLLSSYENIELKGLAKIDHIQTQVRIDDLNLTSDLSKLDFERLNKMLKLKDVRLDSSLQGLVELGVRQMVVGEKGLLVLSADGELRDGKFKLSSMPYPIENFDAVFEVTESDIVLKDVFFYVASGKVNIKSRINEFVTDQEFGLSFNLEELLVEEVIDQKDLPYKFVGKLSGKIDGTGRGFELNDIKSALKGKETLFIKDGLIKDINLLKFMLNKISMIPNLAENLEENLSEKHKEKLKLKDTLLDQVSIDGEINQGVFYAKSFKINTDDFQLFCNGTLNIERYLVLNHCDLTIARELSSSIVASVEELRGLLNEQGQIYFPLTSYNGKMENIIVYPDLSYLGKRIIRERGEKELKKALNKALGIDDEQQAQTEQGQNTDTPQEKREVRPEEIIIENVLDAIFK